MSHYLHYTCNNSKNQAQALQGLEEFASRNTYTNATIAKMRSQLIGMVLVNPNIKSTSNQKQFLESIKNSKSLFPKQSDCVDQLLNKLEGKANA